MTKPQQIALQISNSLAGENIEDVGQALAILVGMAFTMALELHNENTQAGQRRIAAQFMAAILRNMRPPDLPADRDPMFSPGKMQ